MSKNLPKSNNKLENPPKSTSQGKAISDSRKNSQNSFKNISNSRKNSQFAKNQDNSLIKSFEKPRNTIENPINPLENALNPLENAIIPLEKPIIPHENKKKILDFFKEALNSMKTQSNSHISGLQAKIKEKIKPSIRLLGFFASIPEQIQAKTFADIVKMQGKFHQTKFEEDQKKFVADLKKEQEKEKKALKVPKKGQTKKIVKKLPEDRKDQRKLVLELEKAQEKERNLALVRPNGKNKADSINNSLSPEIQRQLDEIEKAKEIEKEATRKRLIDAEKKKMLIEQKIREIDKEIHSIENSVSQRILEETESQNTQIIKILEEQSLKEAASLSAELTKKMYKFKHEQEERKLKKREELDKDLIKRLEDEKQKRGENEEKWKEEKRLKILAKLERINKRKEDRKTMQETANSIIKKSKSHYQQTLTTMEKQYERNIDIPQLERKKKDLESRRNLYKPIDGNEIKEHEKKYEENKKLKEQDNRIKNLKDIEQKKLTTKKYDYSRFLQKALENDNESRYRNEKSKEKRKELMEKQQKYQSIIKDLFKPKVDIEKKKELELRISSEKEKSLSKIHKYEIEPIGEILENSGDFKTLTGMKPQSEFSGPKSRKKMKINYELPWKTIKQSTITNRTVEDLNKEFIVTEMEANKNSKKYENYLKVRDFYLELILIILLMNSLGSEESKGGFRGQRNY